MPNIELKPTDTWTIALGIVDPATGAVEPIPAGDVFSVGETSSPAIEATIGTTADGKPAVLLRALTLPDANTMGMSFTVTDSNGDVALKQGVDYPAPAQPGDITLDIAGAVVGTQPAPTTAGP